MFHDIDNYHARYNAAEASDVYGIKESGIGFDQYVEIKHHLGDNSTNWNPTDPSTSNPALKDYTGKETNWALGR